MISILSAKQVEWRAILLDVAINITLDKSYHFSRNYQKELFCSDLKPLAKPKVDRLDCCLIVYQFHPKQN
jgi:hypothetical protein